MIEIIRHLLLQNKTIDEYVDNDFGKAIFYEFKPKIDGLTDYILIKEKPLSIGHLEVYQLDILIFGKDLTTILEVEQELRKELNDYKGTKVVTHNGKHIKDMTMLTGGGRQFDEEKDRFISVQYFKITI